MNSSQRAIYPRTWDKETIYLKNVQNGILSNYNMKK